MVLDYRTCRATLFMANLLILSSHHLISGQPSQTFINNSSISWINSPSYVVNSTDGVILTPILLREGNGTRFVCGFLCDYNGTACVFGVLLFPNIDYPYMDNPRLVWSANRNNPVRVNSTLQLRQEGGMFLMDSNGTSVWNTKHKWKAACVLFGKSNDTIWQSFGHPTDCLVPGQRMLPGQKLISSISVTKWNEGLFSFEVKRSGLFAYIESNPCQFYFSMLYSDLIIMFSNNAGYLSNMVNLSNSSYIEVEGETRFMKFEADGHLRAYTWEGSSWSKEADILTASIGDCGYPTVCENYSVCGNGQCSCPQTAVGQTNFLQQINYKKPNEGCILVTPVSCEHSQYHLLMELKDTAYIPLYLEYSTNNTELEDCKRSCLSTCSCKAA